MLFSSAEFWGFFAVVSGLLLLNRLTLRSLRANNLVLLGASYVFYGAWDWRFLALILFCTLQTWIAAQLVARCDAEALTARRRFILAASLVANLAVLAYFKYLGFFLAELSALLQLLGVGASEWTLRVILPVGISFYTFQSLGYVLDVHLRRADPEPQLHRYALFVAFFPQLVAGPIERSTHLLGQFSELPAITREHLWQGTKLIIIGLFLKLFVADGLAVGVDTIFGAGPEQNGGVLALGALYFSFQIYGDFCGYSTMAIGVARLLGYSLMTNFDTPYFAISMQEFWRRWHISLSTFFRDYVYIPLGGNRGAPARTHFNTVATFTVSGIWHGANWTFLLWGLLHGAIVSAERGLAARGISATGRAGRVFHWLLTMAAVACLWVLFRSPDIGFAVTYLTNMLTAPAIPDAMRTGLIFVAAAIMADVTWRGDVRLAHADRPFALVRGGVLALMLLLALSKLTTQTAPNAFIYFQF